MLCCMKSSISSFFCRPADRTGEDLDIIYSRLKVWGVSWEFFLSHLYTVSSTFCPITLSFGFFYRLLDNTLLIFIVFPARAPYSFPALALVNVISVHGFTLGRHYHHRRRRRHVVISVVIIIFYFALKKPLDEAEALVVSLDLNFNIIDQPVWHNWAQKITKYALLGFTFSYP